MIYEIGKIYGGVKLVEVLPKIKGKKPRCLYECMVCGTLSEIDLCHVLTCNRKACKKCCYKFVGASRRSGDLSPLLEDSHTAYYYHGLIYADGSLIRTPKAKNINKLSFHLCETDKDYVYNFAEYLKTSVRDFQSTVPNSQRTYALSVCDFEKVPKLIEILGCGTNKTKNPPSPDLFCNMDIERRYSIAIGMLDGDGSRQLNAMKVCEDGCWLETLKSMYDGLYTSARIDPCGNRARLYISANSTAVLMEHARKYNLPVFERKWFPQGKREKGPLPKDKVLV